MNIRPSTGARPASPMAAGALGTALSGARVHIPITVPRTEIKGEMRLLTRSEGRQIRAEARAACVAMGLPSVGIEVFQEFNDELGNRTVAIAVRNPADRDHALAPLEDWEQADDDQIAELWKTYQDLEEQLDPFGPAGKLTDAQFEEMRAGAKKGGASLLTSYGSRRLAHFALTLVDRLPS